MWWLPSSGMYLPPSSCAILSMMEERGVGAGAMQYYGSVSLVIERLLHGQAATILPYSTAQRYHKVYGLEVIRLDEQDVWLNARLVYRSFESLTAGGRALVAHSLRYAKQLIEKDEAHFLSPGMAE